jgi:hypothetical protein
MPRKKVLKSWVWLTLAMEAEYVAMLDEIARIEKISRSELVRRVLKEWLENEARMKYGLKLLEAEEKVRSSAPLQLSPLVEKRYKEVDVAWHELAKPIVDAKNAVLRALDRYERLRPLAEALRRGDYLAEVEVEGYRGAAMHAPRELREEALRAAEEFRRALSEFCRLRRLFFKRCYYPWLRVRRDVPPDPRDIVEARVTRTLEIIDEVERRLGKNCCRQRG